MADYSPLLQVLKQSAKETGNASCPVQICYGKVICLEPLKIQVDQKITLKKAQLVFTRTAYNLLEMGVEYFLIRQQGGQKYIVLDKVVTL
jgi:hypothetical protein